MPDLPSTSRATMYRTAIGSEVLDRVAREVYDVRDSNGAVFCPRHSAWIKDSAIFNLIKNKDEVSSPGHKHLGWQEGPVGDYGDFKGMST